MPNFVDTVQTADRQFVCVCCDEYDRAQTHSPTGKKKKKDLLTAIRVFQLDGTHIFKRISVTTEEFANPLWKP